MITPALTLPVADPILVFGLAMVVFLTAPLLIQQYRLPGIVGIILVGAAIGPNGIGLLDRGETVVLLGEVGLVYLMFVAGLEIDLDRFIEHRERGLVFGLLSFVVPQVVGTAVGYVLLGLSFAAALLFASIFASHTLLAYPVASRLGIAKRESVTTAVGGWRDALDVVRDVSRDDMVVAVSARRGMMGWHSALRTLPKRISTHTEGNFVVYPATGDRADDRQFLQFA